MSKHLEDTTISQLLRVRSPIFISKYQRGFAWSNEQVDDFISDIENIRELKKKGVDKKHFFGSIVTVSNFNARDAHSYSVVDGQQRLTTVTISIACLVNSMQAMEKLARRRRDAGGKTLSKQIGVQVAYTLQEFMYYNKASSTDIERTLRLSLSKNDNDFFSDLIESLTDGADKKIKAFTESNKKLIAAANRIKNYINKIVLKTDMSVEEKFEELINLRAILTNNIEVVHIISEDRAEAYKLFSTLNDRGEELTDSDLLRSRTLELLESYPSLQNSVEKSWDDILSSSSNIVEKFLRALYASITARRASKREMFDDYQENILEIHSSNINVEEAGKIKSLIEQMKHEISTYNMITNGEWPFLDGKALNWDRQRLEILIKILRHDLCIPLLLSAAANLSESKFTQIVVMLEKFVFKYIVISGKHAGVLQSLYYTQSKLIRELEDTYNVETFKDSLKNLSSSIVEQTFLSNLKEEMIYSDNAAKNRQIKYFFSTLEAHSFSILDSDTVKLIPDKSISYNFDQSELEHIYPQNPKMADRSVAMEQISNRLGNLTFWNSNDNKIANNSNFEAKKNSYKHSSVRMNQELSGIKNWDLDEYSKREGKILAAASLIYSI